MRRKRPLLYDVLGSDGRRRRRQAARGEDGGGPVRSTARKVREIRLSQEFGAVVVAIAVVFIGLSYYLGTLHGDGSRSSGRLALTGSDPGGRGAARESERQSTPSPSEPERYWAIRVCTIKFDGASTLGAARQKAEKVIAFLEKRGYPHVRGHLDRLARQIRIYVGRHTGETTVPLREKMLRDVRREMFEGRPDFASAIVVLVDNT